MTLPQKFPYSVQPLLALGAALLFALGAPGCGGFRSAAGRVSSAAGTALVVVDREAADAYREQAARALEESTSWDDYRGAMVPMDRLEASLRVSKDALLGLDALLQAAEAAADEDLAAAVQELLQALGSLYRAFGAAGLEPPAALVDLLTGAPQP